MLFMGEEYAESSPFLFFVDHRDVGLLDAVRRGRKKAMEAFSWTEEPEDPGDAEAFRKSVLTWESRESGRHGVMLAYYRELLRLRAALPALGTPGGLVAAGRLGDNAAIYIHRSQDGREVLAVLNFTEQTLRAAIPVEGRTWQKRLDSSDTLWDGPGSPVPDVVNDKREVSFSPHSAVIFEGIAGSGARKAK
jgi:maltooligosyltrehalose trehalohydrolase